MKKGFWVTLITILIFVLERILDEIKKEEIRGKST